MIKNEHETLWNKLVDDRGRTLTVEQCFAVVFAVNKIAQLEEKLEAFTRTSAAQRELAKPSQDGNR